MRARILVSIAIAGVLAAGVVVSQVESLRWRAQVAWMKASGRLPELSWMELLRMSREKRSFGLWTLVDGRGAFAAVANPYTAPVDVAAGAEVFREHCSRCHGTDATGDSGPNLTVGALRHGDSDLALYRVVTQGIPGTPMPAAGLPWRQNWQVLAFLRSQQAKSRLEEVDRMPAVEPEAVGYELLEAARLDDDSWLTYGGTYASQRYSRLDLIDRSNVANLRLKWVHPFTIAKEEPVEATPIVVGSVMYVTAPPSTVLALDVATGRTLWSYTRSLPDRLSLSDFRANRGVAVYGDRVFVGTLDAHLIALDAATGALVWDVEIGKPQNGHSITGAPLAIDGKIVTGISGGDFGIRGFIDAYDPATGSRLWRFYTVPEPGEPGSESWGGDSWRTGGGATWVTGSFDPDANLVYWGIGNPAPDFHADARPGDNLFTCSVVALDADSGALRWHFQFTPNDDHDWDSNQVPVLADLPIAGRLRRAMLWANRNGFYYVLDRETGEFLDGRPFVKVSWAEGLDGRGRPIRDPSAVASEKGTLIWPNVSGGTNWWSPAYSPQTQLFYVGVLEQAGVYFKSSVHPTWSPGELFLGGATQRVGEQKTYVRALRAHTGELAWEYSFSWGSRTSGMLATAGDVVFAGGNNRDGLFVALDAETGRELWRTELGGMIHMGPITFASGESQLVVVAAGSNLFAFENAGGGDSAPAPR